MELNFICCLFYSKYKLGPICTSTCVRTYFIQFIVSFIKSKHFYIFYQEPEPEPSQNRPAPKPCYIPVHSIIKNSVNNLNIILSTGTEFWITKYCPLCVISGRPAILLYLCKRIPVKKSLDRERFTQVTSRDFAIYVAMFFTERFSKIHLFFWV